MRILILGAGAIGGYYGGRLAAAGRDITFLVRPARAATLAERKLTISSPGGDVAIAAKTVTRDALKAAYDLVVLGCKAYDLADAITAVGPAVGPGTTVLPLLNGLAHLETLDAAFGAEKVIGGCAHISVTLAKDGSILHFAKLDSLTFGERSGGSSARCEAIATAFAGAGFRSVPSDNVMQVMWEKFALITAASGLTGAMRAPIGAIMATRDGNRLANEMIAECEAVAAASGVPVRPQAHTMATGLLTAAGSPFTASMLRDIEGGGEIECEHLQGDMIRRAEALGVATPVLAMAYCHLQAYRNRRAQG
jgi:2-dehydropantoate 2-reductase